MRPVSCRKSRNGDADNAAEMIGMFMQALANVRREVREANALTLVLLDRSYSGRKKCVSLKGNSDTAI